MIERKTSAMTRKRKKKRKRIGEMSQRIMTNCRISFFDKIPTR